MYPALTDTCIGSLACAVLGSATFPISDVI